MRGRKTPDCRRGWYGQVDYCRQPALQSIHEEYVPGFAPFTKWGIEFLGGLEDFLDPNERIKGGCERMGLSEGCGD